MRERYFFIKKVIKVYSHPRSGTHFLEAFLARNFYAGKDLKVEEGLWGHWSNRVKKLKVMNTVYYLEVMKCLVPGLKILNTL